jgi:putative colanic acid biosynthesis UDP-glucose lipid carrier transferase
MISQRSRGLDQALFLCQLLVVLLSFALAMGISFAFFTSTSILHLQHYPAYALMLMGGVTIEAFSHRERKASQNLLNVNFLAQHRTALRQTLFAAGTLLLYLVATKDEFISRTVLAIYLPILYLALIWANRVLPRIVARWVFGGGRRERTLLIGSAAKARELRQWLCHKAPLGLEAVGLLGDGNVGESVAGLPVLGSLSDLERVLEEHQVNDAILLGLPEDSAVHDRLVDVLEDHGVRIMILSNLEEILRHPVVHIEDDGLSFVTTRQEPLENPLNQLAKRILDLAVALPAVIFLIPPATVLVWLLQRWQSPGPVFFKQARAGFRNQQFEILKFRTMHVNNPDVTRQASQNDARIFPAGRWLRRFSIDELPQFLNVLRGDMSVVGPRPHLLAHNQQFAQQMKKYHIRALVKPGVAGLAQLRGFRGEIRTVDDIRARLESDISYLEDWQLSQDIVIIFQTALQILFLLCNSLLGKKEAVAVARRNGAGYKRGERLGGETVPGYAPHALLRNYRQILGIRFFTGSAAEAVALGMQGGLVVAPAASVLTGIAENPVQRAALVSSDLAITDSGLMVLLWRMITGERITRVSGLEFLKLLLQQPELHSPGAMFWVMPNETSMRRNLAWLNSQGFSLTEENCYIAPNYENEFDEIIDREQMEAIRAKRPSHIIMAIGGGVQERLGAELRRNLDYRPSIYCLGAAIGFLSGDQVNIPTWADQMRLGWLLRCISQPAKFLPRYWAARKLLGLMLEHQGRSPVVGAPVEAEGEEAPETLPGPPEPVVLAKRVSQSRAGEGAESAQKIMVR